MPDPFPRSNRRRTNSRRLNLNSSRGRALRDLKNMSQQGAPDVNAIKRKISDLMRAARDAKDRDSFHKLRAVMNSLSGNVSARVAQRAMDVALQMSGPVGRVLKHVAARNPESENMKQIRKDLAEAEAILADQQRRQEEREQERKKRSSRPVPEPEQPRRQSGPPMPPNTFIMPNGRVRIKTGNFDRSYKTDDPILTRKMVEVQSSNVHSIGFQMNFQNPLQSTLMVRFLGKQGKKRTGPGNLYEYFQCTPDEFVGMRNSASKGKWVWDHLRVRGSRTGHRKRYNLKAVRGNDLPRRATVRNGREAFVPRTRQVRTKLGDRPRTLRSSKPLQLFGKARPQSARPYRGR